MSSCLVAVYGRAGDIIMSAAAINLVKKKHDDIDLVVGSGYAATGEVLCERLGLCRLLTEMSRCLVRDEIVEGCFMSGWSTRMMRARYGEYDQYVNLCLSGEPPPVHVSAYMAFVSGFWKDINVVPPMPTIGKWKDSNLVLYHLGSSDKRRAIRLGGRPHSRDLVAVCIGKKDDPTEPWMDRDARGIDLRELVSMMENCHCVVGGDSMPTHLAGILGTPVMCIHPNEHQMIMTNRSVYFRGHSIVMDQTGQIVARKVRDFVHF